MSQLPAYIVQNKLHYVNLLEIVRRGSGDILGLGEDGVLLYDRGCRSHFMSARTEAAYEALISLVPDWCDQFVGHELWYRERAIPRLGLKGGHVCYSAAYLGKEPLPPLEFGGEIRPLGQEWAERVEAHYSSSFGGVAYIRGAIDRGMLGAFVDGGLAGFVGFHEEGTIGLLEVLPEYRRRGIGEALERAAVDLALERGQYAFGQVLEGNAASLALQRKVGMELSPEPMFWLF